jgi:hypothetical protein
MDNTDKNRTYVLLEIRDDGTEVRQYPNGDIRNQKGQIIESVNLSAHAITPDNARQYHAMRKDKILRAIESRVMDITKTNIPADAIGAIVGKRAEIAMNDDTRTGNEAAKIVLQALDAYQQKDTGDKTTTIRNEYVLDDKTREIVMRIAESRRNERIIVENTAENDENT